MTSRSTLLFLVSLLLTASLAGAATASPAPSVEASAFLAPAAPAASSSPAEKPGCPQQGALPFLAPPPSQKSATCGTCSESVCAGYSVGTVCAYKVGVTYTCQDVYGGTCGGAPITLICNCWHGPLP
jgi:hypothetical protein